MTSKHVVLCWEYGSGLGHLHTLVRVGRALKKLGWKLTLVAPVSQMPLLKFPFDAQRSVPDFTALLPGGPPNEPMSTFTAALAYLGFTSEKFLFTRIHIWLETFKALKPDLLVADYAPLALMAARGKFPTIATGNGYTLPPTNISVYPRLHVGTPQTRSRKVLETVNKTMALCGLERFESLPDIFEASFSACLSFPELDPYRSVREPKAIGSPINFDLPPAPKEPDGIPFAYFSDSRPGMQDRILNGLKALDKPIRVYSLQRDEKFYASVKGSQIEVLESPVPISEVIQHSPFVAHFGGHQLLSEMLYCGVPQFILPVDIEKVLVGNQIRREEIGYYCRIDTNPDPEKFAASIQRMYENSELRHKVRNFASSLREQHRTDPIEIVARQAELLVGK